MSSEHKELPRCGWLFIFDGPLKENQTSYPDVMFAETVAVNSGFNLGVFGNEADARRW